LRIVLTYLLIFLKLIKLFLSPMLQLLTLIIMILYSVKARRKPISSFDMFEILVILLKRLIFVWVSTAWLIFMTLCNILKI